MDEQRCARCRRPMPPVESDEYSSWEALGGPDDQVICPGCITLGEENAIRDEMAEVARDIALAERVTAGLQGTYDGTCVACLQPTDTGLGFEGEAEWIIAGLTLLGVGQDEALQTLASADPRFRPVGKVPIGTVKVVFRVCGACAGKRNFPVALITAAGELPIIAPRRR